MRKNLLLSLSIFGLVAFLQAQTLTIFSTGDSYETKRYGLKNKLGEVVVPAKYNSLSWRKGVYQAEIDRYYGLLDSVGSAITEPEYRLLRFPNDGRRSSGLILAQMGSYYGYLTWTGQVAVPFDFEYGQSFTGGLAPVKQNGKYGVINTSGKLIIPLEYKSIEALGDKYFFAIKNEKSHLLTSAGQTQLITDPYDLIFPPTSGCLVVKKDEKYGVIDMSGKKILPLEYSSAVVLSSSFIFVENRTFQFGYTSTGTLLFKRKYEGHKTSSFQHRIAFKEGGLWGFYDSLGNVALQPQFDEFDVITPYFIKVKLKNKYGIVNAEGGYKIPIKYTLIELEYRELGAGIVKNESYYGLISGYGVELTELKYGFIGLLDVSLDVQQRLIDQNDQLEKAIRPDAKPLLKSNNPEQKQRIWELLKENYSSNYKPISEGLVPVLLDNKWGYLNKSGAVVIPFEFDLVTNFQNGRAEVLKGANRFYIDQSGMKL
jgi:hypothetical protein